MNETVQNLVQAIQAGDALETENAFTLAMQEKLSAKLDDMRVSVAQGMFNQQSFVEEEVESVDEVVRIFHHTADWASPSRSAKNPNDAGAVAHRKAAADAAKTARAGGNFKFKGTAKATPLTPKSSGGNVQAVKAE